MDADVDTVVRQVVLKKKANAIAPIESVMDKNLGEISRHLASSLFAHREDDRMVFASDYPLLPVRRRFWEQVLRILDQTGTDSQLRNQLSMVHKVIQTNLDAPLGTVVPADYLYFDSAEKLLQARVLPRNVYETTLKWKDKGTAEEKLKARACGVIFLINKLTAIEGAQKEFGIRPTIDTIADLLLDDLSQGSSELRSKLPALLEKCDLLTKIQDEYRIITKEGAEWNSEFQNHKQQLANEAHRIEADRNDRIKSKISEKLRSVHLAQGMTKVPREALPIFDGELPRDHSSRLYLWIRDGWEVDESEFLADARQEGINLPRCSSSSPSGLPTRSVASSSNAKQLSPLSITKAIRLRPKAWTLGQRSRRSARPPRPSSMSCSMKRSPVPASTRAAAPR